MTPRLAPRAITVSRPSFAPRGGIPNAVALIAKKQRTKSAGRRPPCTRHLRPWHVRRPGPRLRAFGAPLKATVLGVSPSLSTVVNCTRGFRDLDTCADFRYRYGAKPALYEILTGLSIPSRFTWNFLVKHSERRLCGFNERLEVPAPRAQPRST